MDYALLNLALTAALLLATFLLRKRLLRALGRLLLHGAIEFVQGTFLVQGVSKAEDGTETPTVALSARGKAIVAALVPVLLAEAVRHIKFKAPGPGGLPFAIPEGTDLASLAPAFLQMLPKKYQGIAGLALPFLGQFLGQTPGAPAPGKAAPNPFLKELKP